MQEPSASNYMSSLVPFALLLIVWTGALGLVIWTVLLLRRIARALEQVADTLARRESDGGRL